MVKAPSGDDADIGWAISTIAERGRAVWRFRHCLLTLPVGAAVVGALATQLRMDELWWLLAGIVPLGLGGAALVLSRGPPAADVARAWAVLREVAATTEVRDE